MYQYPEGSSARFYIETNLDNQAMFSCINTPKGRALVSTQLWWYRSCGRILWSVSIPRRVERSFLPRIYLHLSSVLFWYVSIPRRVERSFLPEVESVKFDPMANIVSIPRRVERSFLLQDIAYFTPFCKNDNHILPFFHLRASQKNKFRRRCSYFLFL